MLTLLVVAGLLPILIHVIEKRIAALQAILNEMKATNGQDTAGQIAALRKKIDPRLGSVFGEHIADLLSGIDTVIREQRVQLHDIGKFRHFYQKALEEFPRATLFATSLPLRRYFWKNHQIEQAMADFIVKGGRILRVFFLNDADQASDPEVAEILRLHASIGVDVYITISGDLPCHLRKLFIVEEKGRIAWEVSVGPSQEITQVAASSDPRTTEMLLRSFHEILELESTQRFQP